MTIRRITMHRSALRLVHANERQGRDVAELPADAVTSTAAHALEPAKPRTRRAPAKKKAAAKRRAR